MEIFSCGRKKCKQLVYKYCLNCKTMLCRKHRTTDIKEQQKKKAAEHHYVDVSKFYYKTTEFSYLYCKAHPNEMLMHRCINCDLFACKECPEDWCPKAAGQFHDFDPIRDFASAYKYRISEFQIKLHLNHDMLLTQMKEACRKLDNTSFDLEKMLKTVDSVVESKIIAIREEGETFKNEISIEIFKEKSLISEKIKSIEAKEETIRQLLHDISDVLRTADGAMVVHNYSKLKERITGLLTWEATDTTSASFVLVEDAKLGSLCLRLQKTNLNPVPVSEELVPPEAKATEIKQIGQHYSGHTQQPACLIFLFADKMITGLCHVNLRQTTIEVTKSGTVTSRTSFELLAVLLLPYGNQILMLVRHPHGNKYRVLSMSKETIAYEYVPEILADSKLKEILPFLPRIAVTSDHRLIVLDVETQTLHIVSLINKVEYETFKLEILFVGIQARDLMASSDGKLFLSCVKEGRFFIVKYDASLHQVIWVSNPLGEHLPVDSQQGLRRDKLLLSSYRNYIYATSMNKPTKVWRLNLSGELVQEISLNGLPGTVTNISLRGNTLAVAGAVEGIKVFRITDNGYNRHYLDLSHN